MKALKYGLALVLGLSMLGLDAFAHASSIVSNVSQMPDANTKKQQPQQSSQEDQRGIPMPKNVEALLTEGNYSQAAAEFENFVKAKTSSCDLIYLACMFYDRLSWMDEANGAIYKQKKMQYINKFQAECGNTVDAYIMKYQGMEPKNWDSAVDWMTKAIAVDSSMGSLYTMRGSALWQLGKIKEACADFKKAMETDVVATDMYNMQCANLPEEPEVIPAESVETESAPTE